MDGFGYVSESIDHNESDSIRIKYYQADTLEKKTKKKKKEQQSKSRNDRAYMLRYNSSRDISRYDENVWIRIHI